MRSIALAVFCLASATFATISAARTVTLDADAFAQRRETSLNGQELGPFRLYGGVAWNLPGRGFGADDDSWIRASSFNDFGPLTIESVAPARLIGGWFSSESEVAIVPDLNSTHLRLNDPTYFDVGMAWEWRDLDIPFMRRISIAGCEPIGDWQDDLMCFFDRERLDMANVDSLVFEIMDGAEATWPDGPAEIPTDGPVEDPTNPIPEPATIILFGVIFLVASIFLPTPRRR